MGGSYYDRDVEPTQHVFSEAANAVLGATTTIQPEADPLYHVGRGGLTAPTASPVVVAIDVTGSMGNWSKTLYDKLPMLYGELFGYLDEPCLSFAAVGDTQDTALLQAVDFAQGNDIDNAIGKLWLEGHGGGNGKEDYQYAAYFYSRCCAMPEKLPRQGFFFITGDDCFGKSCQLDQIGRRINPRSLDEVAPSSADVWNELKAQFDGNVFFLRKDSSSDSKSRKVQAQWESVLGASHVLHVRADKAVVDIMLGVVALVAADRTLDEFCHELNERGQTVARQEQVRTPVHPAEVWRSCSCMQLSRRNAHITPVHGGIV